MLGTTLSQPTAVVQAMAPDDRNPAGDPLAPSAYAPATADAEGDTDGPEKVEVVDVLVDRREGLSTTFAVLASRSDVALTVATLRFGDYSIGGRLSFERKSAEDLGRSIVDGRLFRQMSALRRHAERPVLLVEGLEASSSPSGVPWPAVRGALVSVAGVFGVPTLFSAGPEESAEIIVTAGRQLRRATDTAYCRPGYRPKGWRKRALFILQGLPQVGPRRAQALLEGFGSVAAVMSASAERLARVDGIGAGVAGAIVRAAGEEPPAPPAKTRATPGRRPALPSEEPTA